jgi:lipopolysaccharide export system protein LptC
MLSVALLAVLGLVTFYLAEVARREKPKIVKASSTEPDYYVTGFSLLKLNEQGKPVLRLSAKKLVHYPDKDTSEFEQPQIVTLRPDRVPVVITASKALGNDSGELIAQGAGEKPAADQLVLTGQARMTRSAGAGKPELTIETESMTINVENETAIGTEPVKIQNGVAVTLANGFSYDHQKQLLTLSPNVKSTWPPK